MANREYRWARRAEEIYRDDVFAKHRRFGSGVAESQCRDIPWTPDWMNTIQTCLAIEEHTQNSPVCGHGLCDSGWDGMFEISDTHPTGGKAMATENATP